MGAGHAAIQRVDERGRLRTGPAWQEEGETDLDELFVMVGRAILAQYM